MAKLTTQTITFQNGIEKQVKLGDTVILARISEKDKIELKEVLVERLGTTINTCGGIQFYNAGGSCLGFNPPMLFANKQDALQVLKKEKLVNKIIQIKRNDELFNYNWTLEEIESVAKILKLDLDQ